MNIRHHAYLYAVLCKNILQFYGKEKGEEVIYGLTHSYGVRRGKRMKDNSQFNDINDFFINGEWKGQPGENISSLSYEKDQTSSTVTKCAWYDTWKEYGLLEYGTYYCHFIDKAICEGYDGGFTLDVPKALGYGDDECVFLWSAEADQKKVEGSEKKHILPFDFHCKELLSCAKEVIDKDHFNDILNNTKAACVESGLFEEDFFND